MIHAGKNVSYANIDSPHGHDAFLLPGERYQAVLGNFLTRAYDKACNAASPLHTAPQEASHA
jgi:homoserine O-acetyltransferase